MNPEPDPVESLFAAVVAKPADQRAAFLDQACAGAPALRQRVEALLKAHAAASGQRFLAEASQPSTAAEAPAESTGTRVGPYKLLQQIGEGGMGIVYMAEQEQPVRRRVALKIIKPGMDSAQVIARFEAERQALAMMDHQNIARVLDAGTTPSGRPYFVMELVHGIPITRFCDENQLTPRQRLELFVPVCQAIQHAHQKGIIHRDVKPSNVLVTLYDDKPVPKVIDFGVAKAIEQRLTEKTLFTQFGTLVGTFEYMSPEQAEMNAFGVDTRSDVYSLGVLLYELLTGTTPLERERLRQAALGEVVRLIREEEPPRPSARLSSSGNLPKIAAARKTEPARLALLVRGELDWIVMRCLEKDRARRYETASALARDVERYLHDEPVDACPPSAGYRLKKFLRRNGGRVFAAGAFAAMLLVVVGLVAYGFWWAERQSAERRHQEELAATRVNAAFNATLDQAEAALKSSHFDEAGVLLRQASRQLEEVTSADLRERYDGLDKDEKTLRELDDIFLERWMISRSDTRVDNTRAKRRYPALFRSYGLAVGKEPAARIAERIHRSSIADGISNAMTDWFFIDPQYPGLLEIVNVLDPDRKRIELRTAIAHGDQRRASLVGKTINGSQLAPACAIGVANHLPNDGLRVLKDAWKAHPDSFPLALTVFSRTWGATDNKSVEDAIGFCRVAVALRPTNAVAHYFLAEALDNFGRGDEASAIEELRRAIQLAPCYARAYGKLAYHLDQPTSGTEALALARKAIKLDKNSILAHVVLFGDLLRRQDWVGAAEAYRKLSLCVLLDDKEQQNGWVVDAFGDAALARGAMDTASAFILEGFLRTGKPLHAYGFYHPGAGGVWVAMHPDDSYRYNAGCAAALAGTGQGSDAPPVADRIRIRQDALAWLTDSLNFWARLAGSYPAFCAGSIGLIGAPLGQGPLLAASSSFPERPGLSGEPAKVREVVHKTMNHWLSDSNLARVREEQWLDKLPTAEQKQWRAFWGRVRSLRDWTASRMHSAKP